MNLFDCQLLSSPSMNHSYEENQPNYDHTDMLNQNSDSMNESTASAQDFHPPAFASTQKNPDNTVQKAIYKGPDVFGKVLGPTADESILVGLQALLEMAGTLEFSNFTPDASLHEAPADVGTSENRDVSETATQNSASCQCSVQAETNLYGLSEGFSEEPNHEIMGEIQKKPCKYKTEKNSIESREPSYSLEDPCILQITHKNISASVHPRKKKCQESQTRVLPPSMTCYDPERMDYPNERSNISLPCPNMAPQRLSSNFPFSRVSPSNRRPLPSPTSPSSSANCPCSQFYQQTTTISAVLGTTPEDPHDSLTSPRREFPELIEQTNIIPNTTDTGVDAASFQEKISLASEPTKEIMNTSIQTLPVPRPLTSNATVETDSIVSQEKSSVACACNFCMPISAGVSKPPSESSHIGKTSSSVRFADEAGVGCLYTVCCEPRQEENNIPVKRNKSCSCALIQKGARVADAAVSCLKVNTSCQYYRTEIAPIESRSTQYSGKLDISKDSCLQICSDSGDYRPHKKKSVRILGGPYECREFSETRYCMEPDKSISRSVLPLLDCNDELSKFYFEKPAKVCLEMGDSFIPSPIEVRYAITKITKFRDFSTFEVMKSTSKKPKCLPKAVEGVFVLKKEDNYSSKMYE